MPRLKKTREEWINNFKEVHHNKYDYSKSIFLKSSDNIEIICPIHNSFFQKPSNHRNGVGCPKCHTDKFWNEEKLKKEIISRYQDDYSLDKFVVKHNSEKMILGCKKCNQDFLISRERLTKFGKVLCPNCKKLNTEKCIEIANKKHNFKYDYSKFIFNGCMEKSIIICKEHGQFEQQVSGHIYDGKGCPVCAANRTRFKLKNLNDNILDLNKIHNYKYNYSLIEEGSKVFEKVKIICSEHGVFEQLLNNHKNGAGCPTCNSNGGKWQFEIIEFLKNECGKQNIIERNRNVISKELDIYLPNENLAIELNGFLFHSYGTTFPNNIEDLKTKFKNHQNKFIECKEKNIDLIQISDLDWKYKNKKEIWKNIIKHKLKLNQNSIGARTLIIKIPTIIEEKDFLNKYHIQGYTNSSVRYGLYNKENELVYLMTFIKNRYSKQDSWELLRCCGIHQFNINGGASKLLKHFEKNYSPKKIFTFANLNYSNGNLYNKLGFEFLRISPPNYRFINNRGENYSRQFFQKHKLEDLYSSGKISFYDKNLTAIQNVFNNYYRLLPDAGNMVFEKTY